VENQRRQSAAAAKCAEQTKEQKILPTWWQQIICDPAPYLTRGASDSFHGHRQACHLLLLPPMIAHIFLGLLCCPGPRATRAFPMCKRQPEENKHAHLRTALNVRERTILRSAVILKIIAGQSSHCWLLGKEQKMLLLFFQLQFTLAQHPLGQNSQPAAWLPSSFAHTEMN